MTFTRTTTTRLASALVAGALVVGTPLVAEAATSPAPTAPSLIPVLTGYNDFWVAATGNPLHGTVENKKVLQRDDALTVWINRHASKKQQFRALQDSEYNTTDGSAYDQSVTISTGLGSTLGAAYVQLTEKGLIPKTVALINSSNGSAGAYVSTGDAKAYFSHPRPYLPTDATTPAVAGDAAGCTPTTVNASSLAATRANVPWANSRGNLLIQRVAPVVDTTKQFSTNDVTLDAGYGTVGICTGGSFPSGHTTTAYEAGITLATLLPELAPEILSRASENGNDRIVLGVHYPLDIMGGRIDGEVALAALWSNAAYRDQVLLPARAELVKALEKATGHSLAWTIKHQKAYSANPYNGKSMPGGTAQIVTNRRSAVAVFTERMTYGFPKTGTKGLAPKVPAGAENLLRTSFPTLTDAQRRSVLAQTEIASGYPLDGTGTAAGSWERLNLAAATSATVALLPHGVVKVLHTGGKAAVVRLHR